MILEFSRQTFEKCYDTEFDENQSCGSRVVVDVDDYDVVAAVVVIVAVVVIIVIVVVIIVIVVIIIVVIVAVIIAVDVIIIIDVIVVVIIVIVVVIIVVDVVVVAACGRTDTTKPILASRNFANSPKNALYYKNDTQYPNSACAEHAGLRFFILVVCIITTQLQCINFITVTFILQEKTLL
jgi:energy-coupling factor transporter transmembrane protein EcfT